MSQELINERLKKVELLRELGVDPYGNRFDNKKAVEHILNCPVDREVRGTGRVLRKNDRGKLIFVHIQDQSGHIQLMFAKHENENVWPIIKQLDRGDIVGFDGIRCNTKSGEPTVRIADLFTVLCKSTALAPEKYSGIKDEEILSRQPYKKYIYEEGALNRIRQRSGIIRNIRNFLDIHNFEEVETPILQTIEGGAAAKPFQTKHNALNIDLSLRIAPELYLKRLLVAGMERIFEIGKNFRNEGIDQTHNPEFTMCEIYQAYGDYKTMEDLFINLLYFLSNDIPVPINIITYAEAFAQTNVPLDLTVNSEDDFDKLVQPTFNGWTLVKDYPSIICPLTKPKRDNPLIAERWEMFYNGMEVANAYTELNDPKIQEENFKKQNPNKIDHDFLEALKVGMPPAGGLGFGIDRLVMLLTNTDSIKDVITFPLVKPNVL